jgi:hypothetical protein
VCTDAGNVHAHVKPVSRWQQFNTLSKSWSEVWAGLRESAEVSTRPTRRQMALG